MKKHCLFNTDKIKKKEFESFIVGNSWFYPELKKTVGQQTATYSKELFKFIPSHLKVLLSETLIPGHNFTVESTACIGSGSKWQYWFKMATLFFVQWVKLDPLMLNLSGIRNCTQGPLNKDTKLSDNFRMENTFKGKMPHIPFISFYEHHWWLCTANCVVSTDACTH